MPTTTLQPDSSSGVDAPIASAPYAAINYGSQTLMLLGSVFVAGTTVLNRGLLRFDFKRLATFGAQY